MCPSFQSSGALPSDFTTVLTLLAHDESLSYNYGSVRETALEYLSHLSGDGFNSYLLAQQMCQSLHSTCSFLTEYANLVS